MDPVASSSGLQWLRAQFPPARRRRLLRICGYGMLWLGFCYLLTVGINVTRGVPPLKEIEAPRSFVSSHIYSSDFELLGRLHRGENREVLDLSEVSPFVVDALIATEDRRFFDHSGIDPKALWASIWRFLSRGRVTGGSTLTMQLARNLYEGVGREKSLDRKFREMITAVMLERNYTKAEILTTYLNAVNIYGNCYGIETAAQRLFGKPAADLDLLESALIVGLLKGQGRYDPYRNPELALARRNLVLQLMAENGGIAAMPLDSLQQIPVHVLAEKEEAQPVLAPYFRERVRLWMEDWGKAHGYNVYTDGLEVYTTLDSRVQTHAEAAVAAYMPRLQGVFDKHMRGQEPWRRDAGILTRLMEQSARYQAAKRAGHSEADIREAFERPVPMQLFSWQGEIDTVMSPMDSLRYISRFLETGMVVISPATGEVKAWVGGIDYNHFKYDHVAFSKRQTGSTFKPFVYAAAIDNGIDPCERFLNQRMSYDYDEKQLPWSPQNVSGSLGGFVTLRQALRYSLNVVTARLTKQVTPQTVVDYAHLLGIQSEIPAYPAICLGTTELSVLEMTGAYATFANGGTWREPVFVKEIRDKKGKVLFRAEPAMRNALSGESTYIMVDLLKASGALGTLRNSQGKAVEAGGKTGTTQEHSDGWFIGITPDLAAGVWVGCAERKMRFRSVTYGQGAYMAKPIVKRFLESAYQDELLSLPHTAFDRPARTDFFSNCWTQQESESYELKGKKEDQPRGFKGWE